MNENYTIDEQDLAAWLAKQTWSKFAVEVAASFAEYGRMTPSQYQAGCSMKAKVEARRAESTFTPSVGVGFFRSPAGRLFEVVHAKQSDRVYALEYKVVLPDGEVVTEFAQGVMAKLTPEMELGKTEFDAWVGWAVQEALGEAAKLAESETYTEAVVEVVAEAAAEVDAKARKPRKLVSA